MLHNTKLQWFTWKWERNNCGYNFETVDHLLRLNRHGRGRVGDTDFALEDLLFLLATNKKYPAMLLADGAAVSTPSALQRAANSIRPAPRGAVVATLPEAVDEVAVAAGIPWKFWD